jgi:glycerol uptake facilitator-like aquaporin
LGDGVVVDVVLRATFVGELDRHHLGMDYGCIFAVFCADPLSGAHATPAVSA